MKLLIKIIVVLLSAVVALFTACVFNTLSLAYTGGGNVGIIGSVTLSGLFIGFLLAGSIVKQPHLWRVHAVILVVMGLTGFLITPGLTTGAGVYPVLHSTPLIAFVCIVAIRAISVKRGKK